jgi:hypothetical protein
MQIFSKALLEETGSTPIPDLDVVLSPLLPDKTRWPAFPPGAPWLVIRSRLLREDILLVCEKNRVREAELEHPGLTTYVLPEMRILRDFEQKPDTIRRLHRIKKEMHGWITRPGA